MKMKYHMVNRKTGWLRHAHGDKDTSDKESALIIPKYELDEWIVAFSDEYKFVLIED